MRRVRANVTTSEVNWHVFMRQVKRHGVAGLVDYRLSAGKKQGVFPEGAIPNAVYERLRGLRRRVIKHNMERLRELIELVKTLDDRGISVMPFKGPLLAEAYYSDLAFRQYGDLDILVHRDDVLKAKRVLMQRGYKPHRDLTADEEKAFIDSQMAYEFVRERDRLIVEVHWALMHKIHSFRLQAEAVWRNAEKTRIGGHPMKTLAFNDLVIYLAAHGSKHGWYRLLWACDMDRVIRQHSEANWSDLLDQARQIGSGRALRLGLYAAHRWIDTPLPPAARDAVNSDDALPNLLDYVEDRWLFANIRPKDDTVSGRAPYFMLMNERWRDRWAYYKHLIWLAVTPTRHDRVVVSLPASLSPLYYVVRPFRLLRDWIRNHT